MLVNKFSILFWVRVHTILKILKIATLYNSRAQKAGVEFSSLLSSQLEYFILRIQTKK